MDPKEATILLIEDERILCDMYEIKFRMAGLRLVIAHGGYEGLALAKQEHPHLILLDIKMDDLDGFEVLKRLKADPSLVHIPVCLLTNMGEKDNAEKGIALGAESYIMKAKVLPSEIIDIVTNKLVTITN